MKIYDVSDSVRLFQELRETTRPLLNSMFTTERGESNREPNSHAHPVRGRYSNGNTYRDYMLHLF